MSYYKTEGIVCSRYKLGDSDRIVHLYSSRGLVRAVAKGIRKPKSRFTGRLEPFCHVRVMLSRGRNLDIVSQVELIDPFIRVRSDLSTIAAGSAALNFVERIAEHESSPGELLPLLTGALTELEKKRIHPLLVLSALELKAARILGYLPSLDSCAICGNDISGRRGRVTFDPSYAGLLCERCSSGQGLDAPPSTPGAERLSLSPASAGVLRMLSQRPVSWIKRLSVAPSQLDEVRQALEGMIAFHLDLNLKSYKFLKKLNRRSGRQTRASKKATGG